MTLVVAGTENQSERAPGPAMAGVGGACVADPPDRCRRVSADRTNSELATTGAATIVSATLAEGPAVSEDSALRPAIAHRTRAAATPATQAPKRTTFERWLLLPA